MLEYFKQVYAKGKWGKGSGVGSDPRNVPDYIGVLQTFLRDMQIRSVVDVGCGDWQLAPASTGRAVTIWASTWCPVWSSRFRRSTRVLMSALSAATFRRWSCREPNCSL